MRFDDSLKTVLSADMATGFGAQSAWRQLVDLLGRGRVPAEEPALARLRMLRQVVPADVRAASGRALALATPPAALVGFFAEDELAIAAPVLRTATLPADAWIALLGRLSPAGRSVLRHRRDLDAAVQRGLASFGSTDFVLPDGTPGPRAATPPEPESPVQPQSRPGPTPQPAADTPLSETPFVALGEVARGLPLVAAALRQAEAPRVDAPRFEIADLVARIDAFQRGRAPDPAVPVEPEAATASFRFETDAAGVIRWVDGVMRGGLVGTSLAHVALQGHVQVDGTATGAFRQRAPFRDARLEVGGASDAAGAWRMSGRPVFDRASGRFTGFRGAARRPRRDESASGLAPPGTVTSDSLRQLVHELRTPANAVSGFAELIETELLGPVPETYRARAATIRALAADLLAAIDDLDMAARIEGGTLDLRAATVPVLPLMARVVDELTPLARLRGAAILLDPASHAVEIAGDDRAVERLVTRLAAALVSAAGQGERLRIGVVDGDDAVAIRIDRPLALAGLSDGTMLTIDADREEADGAPLLGTGFALRLAQKLAVELGGALAIGADALTLRLPLARGARAEQATTR